MKKLTPFLAFVLFCLISTASSAQTANQMPNFDPDLDLGNFECSGGFSSSTFDNTWLYDSGGQPSNEIWYEFLLNNTVEVTLSTWSAFFDTDIHLYTSITGAEIAGGGSTITITLPAGRYFLASEGHGDALGDITTDITVTPCE